MTLTYMVFIAYHPEKDWNNTHEPMNCILFFLFYSIFKKEKKTIITQEVYIT